MKDYYQIYENIILTDELLVKDDLTNEVIHLIKSKNIILILRFTYQRQEKKDYSCRNTQSPLD